jgi:hypothetical protein
MILAQRRFSTGHALTGEANPLAGACMKQQAANPAYVMPGGAILN